MLQERLPSAVRPPGHGWTYECPVPASGHGRGGTPGPIPNPEVKPPSADGTAERVRGRAGRRWPAEGIRAREGGGAHPRPPSLCIYMHMRSLAEGPLHHAGALLVSAGGPAGYACSMEALRAAGPPSLCSRPCAPCMRGPASSGAGGGPIAAIVCHICRTAPPACTYAVPGIPCRASACLRVVQKLCRGRTVLAQGGGGAYCYSPRSSAPGNPGRRQRGEP